MAKNKRLIWILLPGVLLIWGLIAYRIKSALGGKQEIPVVPMSAVPPVAIPADTAGYELQLDYDDPFLKNNNFPTRQHIPVTQARATGRQRPKVTKTVTKIPLKWPAIQYHGIITPKKGGRSLYLIEVDGASVFMGKGEEQQELQLIEAAVDSIKLEYKGEERRTFVKTGT